MTNKLITASEAARELLSALADRDPADVALFFYDVQTSLGGFPVDESHRAALVAACAQEAKT